jgi:hypothetical protein
LAESNRCYEPTGSRPRLRDLKADLVKLKKSECPWLYDLSAHIGQQALVDLDKAFQARLYGVTLHEDRASPPQGDPFRSWLRRPHPGGDDAQAC